MNLCLPGHYGWSPDVAVDGYGKAHVVWRDDTNTLWYTRVGPNFTIEISPMTLAEGAQFRNARICVDNLGKAHIVAKPYSSDEYLTYIKVNRVGGVPINASFKMFTTWPLSADPLSTAIYLFPCIAFDPVSKRPFICAESHLSAQLPIDPANPSGHKKFFFRDSITTLPMDAVGNPVYNERWEPYTETAMDTDPVDKAKYPSLDIDQTGVLHAAWWHKETSWTRGGVGYNSTTTGTWQEITDSRDVRNSDAVGPEISCGDDGYQDVVWTCYSTGRVVWQRLQNGVKSGANVEVTGAGTYGKSPDISSATGSMACAWSDDLDGGHLWTAFADPALIKERLVACTLTYAVAVDARAAKTYDYVWEHAIGAWPQIYYTVKNFGAPEPTPTITDTPIEPTPTPVTNAAISVRISASPTRVGPEQEILVNLEVTNISDHTLTDITSPISLNRTGEGDAYILDGPNPWQVGSLPSGGKSVHTYKYKADKPGKLRFEGDAHALDNGNPVYSGPVQSNEIDIFGLRILEMKTVQTIFDVPMIANKPTVLCATVESLYSTVTNFPIQLDVKEGNPSQFTDSLNFDPGKKRYFLPPYTPPASPAYAHFTLARTGPIKLTLDPPANSPEPLLPGQSRTINPDVVVVAPLKMLYQPLQVTLTCINVGWPPGPFAINRSSGKKGTPNEIECEAFRTKTDRWFKAVYPIPAMNSVVSPVAFPYLGPVTEQCVTQIWKMIGMLSAAAKVTGGKVERVIGILPDKRELANLTTFYGLMGQPRTLGEASPTHSLPGCLVCTYDSIGDKGIRYDIALHEIGHTFGLPIGGGEEYDRYPRAKPCAHGYWVEERKEIQSKRGANGWWSPANFMTNDDGMNPIANPPWVAQEDYLHLLNKLRKPNRDPEVFLISGYVQPGGNAVTPDPWYTTWINDLPEEPTSTEYSIVSLNTKGEMLDQVGLEVSSLMTEATPSDPLVDGWSFVAPIPKQKYTNRIQVRRGTGVLYERTITPHKPTVTFNTPTGGEEYVAGTSVLIEWSASDSDSPELWHTLFFSPDGGGVWLPLAANIQEASFTFTIPDMGTHAGTMKVLTTDGVNTTSAVSGAFSIIGSATAPLTAYAGVDQQVYTGKKVTLDGTGSYDPLARPLTFHWRIAGLPENATVSLERPDTSTPALVPMNAGMYLFELTVNNGIEDSSPAYTTVLAEDFDLGVFDLNGDALVNAMDLILLIQASRTNDTTADFNKDKQVDWNDLYLFNIAYHSLAGKVGNTDPEVLHIMR